MLQFCDSCAIGRHFQRKNDANGRSMAKLALSLDPAAVQLGNMFHNRQPKTGPAEFATARFVRAIKPLEDARQILLTNADTIIAYAQRDLIAGTVRFETNFTALTRIFNGIIEQIIKNLPQARFVRADYRNDLGTSTTALKCFAASFFFQSRTRPLKNCARSIALNRRLELPDSSCASVSRSFANNPRRFECWSIISRMRAHSVRGILGSSSNVSM